MTFLRQRKDALFRILRFVGAKLAEPDKAGHVLLRGHDLVIEASENRKNFGISITFEQDDDAILSSYFI